MTKMVKKIIVWQTIPSPHTLFLANELRKIGYIVDYNVETEITQNRVELGWQSNVDIDYTVFKEEISHYVSNNSESDVLHILQGIRGESFISRALKEIRSNSARYSVMMETLDFSGFRGVLRKILYKLLFVKNDFEFILAIGGKHSEWITPLVPDAGKIVPYCYFIDAANLDDQWNIVADDTRYKFVYIGQIISRKGLDYLLEAFHEVSRTTSCTLDIYGPKAQHEWLKKICKDLAIRNVTFLDKVPMHQVHSVLSNYDTFVLPSRFDGWGVTTNEALFAGCKVIVSKSSGSSYLIENILDIGDSFDNGNVKELSMIMQKHVGYGTMDYEQRKKQHNKVRCLYPENGALFLDRILKFGLNDDKVKKGFIKS